MHQKQKTITKSTFFTQQLKKMYVKWLSFDVAYLKALEMMSTEEDKVSY